MSSRLLIVFLVISTIFTRFYKLDWGNGYFFHPDENNMASALSQLSDSNLNPHFFAYGQFPLYLGYFTLKLIHLPNSFEYSINVLRIYSAVFSILIIIVAYLLSFEIFHKPIFSTIFTTLLIFSPGLIQISHFGTTESLLALIFVTIIYLSYKIVISIHLKNIFLAGFVSGVGVATKISAILFIIPVFFAIVVILIKSKKVYRTIIFGILFLILFAIFGLVLSPYNFIEFSSFISAMEYETRVATGNTIVFYTQQFDGTLPYLFQFIRIFPYSIGIPTLVLAVLAILKLNRKIIISLFMVILPCIIYFLYFGQVYTKWTRFMSPIFFIFPLFATIYIIKIKSKILQTALISVCIIPGIYFFSLYLRPDIRVVTSDWINNNIEQNSHILSESGNVVNIPLFSDSVVENYDFYEYNSKTLALSLLNSDYIIVPSRRVFKNYNYKYYDSLFNGKLGFLQINKFSYNYSFLLNDELAEETWSVFDHPTIRLYKKVKSLSADQYEKLL